MYYIIYEIKNNTNGKIYVGYHKTKNLDDGYMGSGLHIKRVIKKYGKENFTKKILHLCKSEKEMKLLEVKIVNEEFIKRVDTYNLKLGGHGGFRKGYVTIKGKQITSEEFRSSNKEGVCKGKVSVFDSNGVTSQVNKNDERLLKGEFKRCFEKNGLISVIDINGKKIRVDKNTFNTGNFTSIYKGLAIVRDNDGKVFKVDVNDTRYISGELVGITKGINFNKSEYNIFDENGIIKYNIKNESFILYCKKNNLPYGALLKSYQSNGCKIYQKMGSNKTRVEKNGFLKYVGWSCVKVK